MTVGESRFADQATAYADRRIRPSSGPSGHLLPSGEGQDCVRQPLADLKPHGPGLAVDEDGVGQCPVPASLVT